MYKNSGKGKITSKIYGHNLCYQNRQTIECCNSRLCPSAQIWQWPISSTPFTIAKTASQSYIHNYGNNTSVTEMLQMYCLTWPSSLLALLKTASACEKLSNASVKILITSLAMLYNALVNSGMLFVNTACCNQLVVSISMMYSSRCFSKQNW